MSVLVPHGVATCEAKLLCDVRVYHVPSAGRYTVMSVRPSPSRSPANTPSASLGLVRTARPFSQATFGKIVSALTPHPRISINEPLGDNQMCQSPLSNVATSRLPSPS